MCMYLYTYVSMCIYIYIYMYREKYIYVRMTAGEADRTDLGLNVSHNENEEACHAIYMRNLLGWLRLGWLKVA